MPLSARQHEYTPSDETNGGRRQVRWVRVKAKGKVGSAYAVDEHAEVIGLFAAAVVFHVCFLFAWRARADFAQDEPPECRRQDGKSGKYK